MASYTIIGGDGKEYGPISSEMMRQWHTDRRVSATTKARLDGTADWRTLAEFPEFSDLFGGQMPPVMPAAAASAPPPLSATPPDVSEKKLSALAVTSLVLGPLGIFSCGTLALVGLILGIIALVKIRNSQGRLTGFGLALAGTIVSGVISLFIIPLAAIAVPNFVKARQTAMQNTCRNNERQLALAVNIYAGDHGNQFPHATTWCDDIKSTAGSARVYVDIGESPANRCGYGFNAKLDGMDVSKVSPDTVEIFESDGGWNANGGPEKMISVPRHGSAYVVAFADGSVKTISQEEISSLRWDP